MPINFQGLAQYDGIHFNHGATELTPNARNLALDSALITDPNAGILSLFTTYVDQKTIDIIVAPMRMGDIFGEVKKGDWTDEQVTFLTVESTGGVSSYGDFSNNGVSGANINFPTRQPYYYQTNVRIGERELAKASRARVDLSAKLLASSILTLNKYQNKSYIFGVAGLQNYGMLNDPSLLPASVGKDWNTLDGGEVFEEIRKLYTQLNKQANGVVDRHSSMLLLLSPQMEAQLTKTNQYNVNVSDQLAKNFPNLEVHSVPEYSTTSGENVQLIVKEYEGQDTVDLSFTVKHQAHAMEMKGTYWQQKRSQSTTGAIIYRPFLIATQLASLS